MSLKSDIIAALAPIAPASFHEYTGIEKTYITFYFYNQRAGQSADNKEISTIYSLQLDLYSNGNIDTKAQQIKAALSPLGYARTSEIELFETSTKTYRISFSFTKSQ